MLIVPQRDKTHVQWCLALAAPGQDRANMLIIHHIKISYSCSGCTETKATGRQESVPEL